MCPNGSGRWPSASWAGLWVKWNSLISRRDSGRHDARPRVLQAGGASSVLLLEMEHMATAKGAAPVGGFNHNVQYGPRLYHVQTEDSGLPHSHYITHLFVGGNIVASMKSSYADLVDAEPDLPKAVRILMEVQHKAMLKRLISGEFNDLAAPARTPPAPPPRPGRRRAPPQRGRRLLPPPYGPRRGRGRSRPRRARRTSSRTTPSRWRRRTTIFPRCSRRS